MKKQDGRRLPLKIQKDRRIRALKAVLEGRSPTLISKEHGVARASIYNWLSAYRQGGLKSIDIKPHGRRRKLTDAQGRWLRKTVRTRPPSRFGFSSPGWTCALIDALILKKWKVKLTMTSIYNLIRRYRLRSYVVWSVKHPPKRIVKYRGHLY